MKTGSSHNGLISALVLVGIIAAVLIAARSVKNKDLQTEGLPSAIHYKTMVVRGCEYIMAWNDQGGIDMMPVVDQDVLVCGSRINTSSATEEKPESVTSM